MNKFLPAIALLLALLVLPGTARATQCSEVISSANIVGGGTFCLGADLNTDLAGPVINITASHVDFDCRGHFIRSTNASVSQNSYGIQVTNASDVHLRNCHIQGGFAAGIYVNQDNGLENQNRNIDIEDNTVEGAFWFGIHAYGTGISIRNNRVLDIGGRPSFAMGIRVGGSVVSGQSRHFVVEGNDIIDVESPGNNSYGIYGNNADASTFAGNIIHDVRTSAPAYYAYAIYSAGAGTNKITGNTATGSNVGVDFGVYTSNDANECYQNHVRFMSVAFSHCDVSIGNY
jgi:parallel beta-helix repeat protein